MLNSDQPIRDAKTITNEDRELIMAKMPTPKVYASDAEILAMTDADADEVLRAVRRTLLDQLMYQEYHEHMLDDCGDDLEAATFNWNVLHTDYFTNDGTDFRAYVIAFMLAPVDDAKYPWGGSDGEIRYALLTDELQESRFPFDGGLTPN